jgi:single-stranded-DNA-specific exonuclease
MIEKRWEVMPAAPPSLLKQYRGMHPILAQVLYNRGLDTPQDAHHFLYDKELPASNPFDMKGMQAAVDRIRYAIKNEEPIVVYGDFDADGVTSTTLMMQVLNRLKANARAYIPHRVDEGYGLNTPALLQLADEGVRLVITVDCGIRSVDEVEAAQGAGLDLVITDHHSVGPVIPDAIAVVNPQQEDCAGDKGLAGVGVAFMVARGLLLDAWMKNGKKESHAAMHRAVIRELLDLVAIGTVADIMPLDTALNRALVRQGIEVINEAKRPGLRALMDVAALKPGTISAMQIGFGIGPRINAAGRLANAMIAVQMLSATDEAEAQKYAQMLQDLNLERQRLTREAQDRIQEQIVADGLESEDLIFAMDDHVDRGIVGLVAGRLTEQYYRPSVVVEVGEEECHASCRSIPQFHITHALDECADLLVRHGGHSMAAGLTILRENLPKLREQLQQKARNALNGQELIPTLHIDMELRLQDLRTSLAEELTLLEPTGHANEQPVFVTRNLRVIEARTVGNGDAHLKLKLGGQGESPIDAIGFRMGDRREALPEMIDVVYTLEINEYQGRRTLQMNLQDMRPAGSLP